jgi:hypothetical protein
MAVTRINNNQITDAVNGNTIYGINANTKLQNYSITSTKLANSLVYGSDFTISGNLTVNGTTTTVDTVNTLIADPLITLADGQTAGTPTVDIGFIGLRGSENSAVMAWQESSDSFVVALSNTTVSNTTFNLSSYADFAANTIVAHANLSVIGNVLGNLNATDYINAGNVTTPGFVSAIGNIQTANFFIGDGAYISNISGANVSATKIANGTSYANIATANGNLDIVINGNTAGTFYDAGASVANLSVIGNVVGNLNATNDITANNITAVTTLSAGGNVVTTNSVNAGNLSLAGNVLSNLNADLNITATSNITGGNILTGGIISAFGTATVGNLSTVGNISATANITGGNVLFGTGIVSGAGNIYGGNISATGDVSAFGNVIGNAVVTDLVTTNTALVIETTAGNSGISIDPNGNGNINVNTSIINNVATPQQAADAANKEYVDSVASGLDLKASCEVGTVQPLDAEAEVTNVVYDNGTAGVGATLTITTTTQLLIDGVDLSTLNIDDRVLIKNELDPASGNSDAAWNGIYTLTSTGALQTVLTRSTDFDNEGTLGSIPGSFTFVIGGGGQAGTGWVCITTNPIVMGTTPILWAQFSGAGQYSGGNAIAVNGTVISALFDGQTVGVNGSNQLYIPANAPLVTPNIGNATGSSLSVTGNVDAGNVRTGGEVSATGNVLSGNVYTGNVSLSGNVISNLSVTGDVLGNNIYSVNTVSAGGNVTGANFITSGSQGNITGANNIVATTLSATANVFTSNLSLTGNVLSTLNVDGNIQTANYFIGDGYYISNINAANVSSTKISNGTSEANIISANGNLDITINSNLVATFYDTGLSTTGNVTTAGLLLPSTSATYDIGAAGLVWSNAWINNLQGTVATGVLTVNGGNATVDFAVNGTGSNVFYVNATTNTASFGTGNQTTNAIVAFNATNSVLMPVGTLGERPSTGVTGMLRFNSTNNYLEVYDNSAWKEVGATQFTVVTDQQFNGDGSTVTFTLNDPATTAGVVVSINGVVQIPTTAYSVSSTTLTFTEAPATGDLIDVRTFSTTVEVTGLSNGSGNAQIQTNPTAANTNVTGNLIVNAGGFLYGDGTYLTNVGGGNVIATKIVEGNSSVDIDGANGNVVTAVNGANVLVTATAQTTITGNFNPSANVTYSLGNTTNRWSNLWLSGNTIYIGGSNISANASTLTFGGNAIVTQNANGNVSGGNVTANTVSTTGNITGSYILGNGSQLTGIDATSIQNGTSNVKTLSSANVTVSVAGTANVAVFATTGEYVTGVVSASGNVIGSNIIGNGYFLTSINGANVTGLNTAAISNGTSNVTIATSNGNITTGVNGTANVVVTATTGQYVTGVVSANGNVTGGNVTTAGLVSATGNATAGNVNTAGLISATGNVTGGNIRTAGQVSATSTITGGTLLAGGISLTGNSITSTNTTITIDPNSAGGVDGAVIIAGNLSVQGNVTYIDSNVITTNEKSITLANNQSTGAALDGAGIDIGNANQYYWRYNNATTSWQANIGITPAANATLNLGGTSNYWANIYAGNTIISGSETVTGNVQAGNIRTTGTISATGQIKTSGDFIAEGQAQFGAAYSANGRVRVYNATPGYLEITLDGADASIKADGYISAAGNIIGGNIFTAGIMSSTGNATHGNILTAGQLSAQGNITGGGYTNPPTTATVYGTALISYPNGSSNVTISGQTGSISAAGNITGGNLSVGTGTVTVGNIVNSNANGVGNIGSSSTYFNTIFAKATSAQYADLAEKYTADAEYAPGTVVSFGGSAEVTQSTTDADRAVAGVISTNPSYIMNGGLEGTVATVALTGRVPTKVTGTVRKGDLMVSNGDGTARAEADPKAGSIIGKALENFDGAAGVIEVVIGRF